MGGFFAVGLLYRSLFLTLIRSLCIPFVRSCSFSTEWLWNAVWLFIKFKLKCWRVNFLKQINLLRCNKFWCALHHFLCARFANDSFNSNLLILWDAAICRIWFCVSFCLHIFIEKTRTGTDLTLTPCISNHHNSLSILSNTFSKWNHFSWQLMPRWLQWMYTYVCISNHNRLNNQIKIFA